MIKLVQITSNNLVASEPEDTSGGASGPSLVSRTTTYRGARRPAPVSRMFLLTLRVPTPAPEEEPAVNYYDAFPVLF